MPISQAKSADSLVARARKLLREDIWHHSDAADRSIRGRVFAVLRVLSITFGGVFKNKLFGQAGTLAYSSLMSLGPVVVLAIIISTFVLQQNSEKYATAIIDGVVKFIAPPTVEFSRMDQGNATSDDGNDAAAPNATDDNGATYADQSTSPDASGTPATTPADGVSIRKSDIMRLIDQLVTAAHSRAVGTLGLVVFVFICIQLIISIENNFNNIWGVRRGRGWVKRVLLYWTVFTLGVLVVFTVGTLLSEATVGSLWRHSAFGQHLPGMAKFLSNTLSFILLALLLALFYRFIPNTRVHWKPALVGGVVATAFLTLNNYLSFLYVRQVLNAKSFFGSIGIILMLMFGLYIFWLLVLFGGQLTYAVQNAANIRDEKLWSQVSPRTRRLLSLAAFLRVARAFAREKPGPRADELAEALHVPANILNECLTRLCDLHLLSPVKVPDANSETEVRYQPSRPLSHLTLGQFHHVFDVLGNVAADQAIEATDPLLPRYREAMTKFEDGTILQRSFATLVAEDEPQAEKKPA